MSPEVLGKRSRRPTLKVIEGGVSESGSSEEESDILQIREHEGAHSIHGSSRSVFTAQIIAQIVGSYFLRFSCLHFIVCFLLRGM